MKSGIEIMNAMLRRKGTVIPAASTGSRWTWHLPIRTLILGILAFLCQTGNLEASHYMGGEITYLASTGNSYRVSQTLYRDCGGAVIGPTSPIYISPPANGISSGNLSLLSMSDITPLCPGQISRCASPSGQFGVQEYVFRGYVTLPPGPSSYTLSTLLCCRNGAISTLSSPSGQQMFLSTLINPNLTPHNNSPRFLNRPVAYLCANQPAVISPNAYDPDGDALVYSLTPCRNMNANDHVVYAPGFNGQNPISTSNGINLDPTTGEISFTPSIPGQVAVLCVKTDEYRDGVIIGQIIRDIQIRVLNCNNAPPAITSVPSIVLPVGTPFCINLTATDSEGHNITLTALSGLGLAASFTPTGSSPGLATGEFCFTPSAIHEGNTFTITINASDDGCPATALGVESFNIIVPADCRVGAEASATSTFCGQMTGTATASMIGGTAPYQYAWSGPNGYSAIGSTITGLAAGTYNVTIVDGNSCVALTSVTVSPTPLSVSLSSPMDSCGNPISCFGGSDGSILSIVNGGCPPFAYAWSNGSNAANPINLGAGAYQVTVTDGNGSTAFASIVLSQPDPLAISLSSPTYNGGWNISCNSAQDGSIHALASGGASCQPYAYNWTGPNGFSSNVENPGALAAGIYQVTVVDANGCSASASITLSEPTPLAVDAGTNVTVQYGYTSAYNCTTLNGTVSGGTSAYTGTWSANGTALGTNASISVCPSTSTTYYYTVVDANGCISTDSVRVCVQDVRCVGTSSNGNNGGNTGGQGGQGSFNGNAAQHVVVCHTPPGRPNSSWIMCLPPNAVPAHLAHGDYLGACMTTNSAPCLFPQGPSRSAEWSENAPSNALQVRAFPNPAQSAIKLELIQGTEEAVSSAEIQLLDLFGKVLQVESVEIKQGKGSSMFNLEGLGSGFYFLSVELGGQRRVEKFMKL